MLFISQLVYIISENSVIEFCSDYKQPSDYIPEPCEECKEKEAEIKCVSGEKDSVRDRVFPDSKKLCLNCKKDLKAVPLKSYRNNKKNF